MPRLSNNDPKSIKVKELNERLYEVAYLIGDLNLQDVHIYPQDPSLITMISTALDELSNIYPDLEEK